LLVSNCLMAATDKPMDSGSTISVFSAGIRRDVTALPLIGIAGWDKVAGDRVLPDSKGAH